MFDLKFVITTMSHRGGLANEKGLSRRALVGDGNKRVQYFNWPKAVKEKKIKLLKIFHYQVELSSDYKINFRYAHRENVGDGRWKFSNNRNSTN